MYVYFGYIAAQLRESPFSKMAAIDLCYNIITCISPASANLAYFRGSLVFFKEQHIPRLHWLRLAQAQGDDLGLWLAQPRLHTSYFTTKPSCDK